MILRRGLSDITQRAICLSDYTDPRSLPCQHTFCLQCLRDICADLGPADRTPCPLCRQDFTLPESGGVDGFPRNFIAGDLVELYKRDSASRFQCDPGEIDGGLVSLRTGRTSKRDGEGESGSGLCCMEHVGEPLEVFCFDCRLEICALCSADGHSAHRRWEVFQVRSEFCLQISTDIQRLDDVITGTEHALQHLDTKRLQVLEGLRNTEFSIVLETADDVEEQNGLLEELREVKATALKKMEADKDRLESSLEMLSSFAKYARSVVAGSQWQQSIEEIVHTAKQIHVRMRELLRDNMAATDSNSKQRQNNNSSFTGR